MMMVPGQEYVIQPNESFAILCKVGGQMVVIDVVQIMEEMGVEQEEDDYSDTEEEECESTDEEDDIWIFTINSGDKTEEEV